MLSFLKRKSNPPSSDAQPPHKQSWLQRLKNGLSNTRQGLTDGLSDLLLGKKIIDHDLLEQLETRLLSADVGIEACETIVHALQQRISRKQLTDPAALVTALKEELLAILQPCEKEWHPNPQHKPHVVLLVGVNGAGKTTSIGKLAHYLQQQQQKVILAAGDTFRAAAVEQLQVWGNRNNVPVIAQQQGADSASVIYDALSAARARQCDVLLADSAGRLHTQTHLMQELQKIVRVVKKAEPSAPHDIFLVLDASMGQNALRQAMQFHDAIGITGIILTKLDGTAKGGIVFAIAKQLALPVYFIGIGEGPNDLRTFVAAEFIEALFSGGNE